MKTLDTLIYDLSEPLNGAVTATLNINAGDGNLTIDTLTGGEPLLASGTLEYLESQGPPAHSAALDNVRATLSLRGGEAKRGWFKLPWDACAGGAYEWHVHINPAVPSDLTAHCDGGSVRLDLATAALTRLAADTGGGNMEVILPDHASNLSATAKTGGGSVTLVVGSGTTGSNAVEAGSGAGNVEVRVPGGIAARIRATSGLGKIIVDPRFAQVDTNTYRSPDYDTAAERIEIFAHSGAGNVSITTW